MVIHVGADPKYSKIVTFNTVTKEIKNIIITRAPKECEDKIENFFRFIKETIKEPLGYFCAMLDGYVNNKTRRRYIEIAEKYGFQKAKILSVAKAEIIDLVKNTILTHNRINTNSLTQDMVNLIQDSCELNEEYLFVFHIKEVWVSALVWQKTKNNSLIFKHFEELHYDYTRVISLEEIKVLKENLLKIYGISKMGFFDYKQRFTKAEIEAAFPDDKDIYHCHVKPWSNSSMIYACHLSGDSEYVNYECNEVLEKKITIKDNDITVLEVAKYTSLPLKIEKIICNTKTKSSDTIFFHIYDFDELAEGYMLTSPPKSFKLVLEVNTDTIFTFKVAWEENELQLCEENLNNTYFRIPGRDIYFDPIIKVIGIDFGTSKCCVAVNSRNGIQTVVLDNNGSRMLPTYISFDEKNVKCGQLVINRMKIADKGKFTVFDIKRILGNSFNEIKADKMWDFELKDTENGLQVKVQTFEGECLKSPEEIASEFFTYIKNQTEEFQKEVITEAVITIPTFYNKNQKQSLEKAAKIAGWKTIYLLPEPVAAAFSYCDEKQLSINRNLIVFDLGGGTMNVSILRTAKCMLHMLSCNGSLKLGGRDFDNVLIKHFEKVLNETYKRQITEQKKFQFLTECQEIKHDLSHQTEASLEVGNYFPKIDDSVSVTREEFEQLSSDLLHKIEKITHDAVKDAKLENKEIDVVLYVGGGCRMPMIKNFLSKIFPSAKHCSTSNPEEMVAKGAALYACFLKSKYP